jgi:hypothetical protein
MEQIKQTAVDLLHEIAKQREPDKFDWLQVKVMENKQMMEAFRKGFSEGTIFGMSPMEYKYTTAEQYYNETYGK